MIATMHPAFAMHPLFEPMRVSLAHRPTARMHTTNDAHVVTMPAPGIAPSDVKVEVHDGKLSIVGDNKRKHVEVSLVMPLDSDPDSTTAEVRDGLITVKITKRPRTTPTTVAIGTVADETETDDDATYKLCLVAAGFAAADLALNIDGGVLSVSGDSKRTGDNLERRARLPRDIDVDKISATHVDGILTVSMPIKPVAEPRRVPVNAELSTPGKEADDEAAVPAADDKHMEEATEAAEAAGATMAEATVAEALEEEAVMV